MRLWDADGKTEPVILQGHTSPVLSVCWSPERTTGGAMRLASSSEDGSVRLWQPDGQPGTVLESVGPAVSMRWSPDGQRLASGAGRSVRLWAPDGQPGPVLPGHGLAVSSLTWSPDSQRLAVHCSGVGVRFWSANGQAGITIRDAGSGVSWSPNGEWLVADGRLWQPDGRPGPRLQGCSASPTWSPDSQRIAAAGGARHEISIYHRDGRVEQTLRTGHVWGVSWSPDGRRLAAAGGAGMDFHSSDGTKEIWCKGPDTRCVTWSPDSQRVASGCEDHTVRLVGVDGQAGPVLTGQAAPVRSVSWSRMGNRLASAGLDGTILVRNGESLDVLWSAVVLPSGRPAVFSPAGQMLAGSSLTADQDFIYVAQNESGRCELFTPSQFQKLAQKGGQSLSLFGPKVLPARPVDDRWVRSVQQLPTAQQMEEVLARLKELNPGYYDPLEHKEANGRIVAITLPPSPALVDLSPLRALTGLEQLSLNGPSTGPRLPLSDLKPLSGLKLKEFSCTGMSIADLAPLQGMPLEKLKLRNLPAAEFRPGKEMPLKELTLRDTRVADLKPLKVLASLHSLDVRGSPVTDLRPVQGLLFMSIACDLVAEGDLPVLRAMPTLTKINDKPVKEFWKAVEGQQKP